MADCHVQFATTRVASLTWWQNRRGVSRLEFQGLPPIRRLRSGDLIDDWSRLHPDATPLAMQVVAEAVGVSRSTLAGLTTLTQEPVTNAAVVECLARFFRVRLPDFEVGMLFEFSPPLACGDTGPKSEIRAAQVLPGRWGLLHDERQRNHREARAGWYSKWFPQPTGRNAPGDRSGCRR